MAIYKHNILTVGNLVADSAIYRASLLSNIPLPEGAWISASIALWNSGGIRSSIVQGTVHKKQLYKKGMIVKVINLK